MNKVMSALIDLGGNTESWKSACERGVFFVVATPVMCGRYSVGCMESSVGELPDLYATKEDAEAENNEVAEDYLQDIKDGERDEEDEWDGEVLEARWNGEDDLMHLYLDGDLIHSGDWKLMAGL